MNANRVVHRLGLGGLATWKACMARLVGVALLAFAALVAATAGLLPLVLPKTVLTWRLVPAPVPAWPLSLP